MHGEDIVGHGVGDEQEIKPARPQERPPPRCHTPWILSYSVLVTHGSLLASRLHAALRCPAGRKRFHGTDGADYVSLSNDAGSACGFIALPRWPSGSPAVIVPRPGSLSRCHGRS